jgi:hypothetical protein
MKLSLQSRTVLSHLRAESHITSWQAEGVYRIRRLASRIDEIVAAGFDVLKTEAKDATGQRYIRYSLSATQKRYVRPINPVRVREVRYSIKQISDACTAADLSCAARFVFFDTLRASKESA